MRWGEQQQQPFYSKLMLSFLENATQKKKQVFIVESSHAICHCLLLAYNVLRETHFSKNLNRCFMP